MFKNYLTEQLFPLTFHKILITSFLFFYQTKSQSINEKLYFNETLFEFKENPSLITFLNYNGDKFIDVVAYENNNVNLYIGNEKEVFSFKNSLINSTSVSKIDSKDLNNDGLDDLVLIHREKNKIEVVLTDTINKNISSKYYDVNFYPDEIIIYDFNNDAILDIGTFGKASNGLTVLVGRKKGIFRPAEILFSDLSISNINVVNLNNDKLLDLVVKNWLNNEIIFFTNLGNLEFYNSDVIDITNENENIIFSTDSNSIKNDYYLYNGNQVRFYEENSRGIYKKIYTFKLSDNYSISKIFDFALNKKKYFVINSTDDLINIIIINKHKKTLVNYNLNEKHDDIIIKDFNFDGQNELIIKNQNKIKILKYSWSDSSFSLNPILHNLKDE